MASICGWVHDKGEMVSGTLYLEWDVHPRFSLLAVSMPSRTQVAAAYYSSVLRERAFASWCVQWRIETDIWASFLIAIFQARSLRLSPKRGWSWRRRRRRSRYSTVGAIGGGISLAWHVSSVWRSSREGRGLSPLQELEEWAELGGSTGTAAISDSQTHLKDIKSLQHGCSVYTSPFKSLCLCQLVYARRPMRSAKHNSSHSGK